jgi:hypothetical protein
MEVDPPDVRDLRPEVPGVLARVLDKMLAKKPDDRYQTPRELLSALTLAEAGEEPGLREPLRQERPAETVGPRLKSAEPPTPHPELPTEAGRKTDRVTPRSGAGSTEPATPAPEADRRTERVTAPRKARDRAEPAPEKKTDKKN